LAVWTDRSRISRQVIDRYGVLLARLFPKS
jgi:hypothetical protein